MTKTASTNPDSSPRRKNLCLRILKAPSLILFLVLLVGSIVVGRNSSPTWTVEKVTLEVWPDDLAMVRYDEAQLHPLRIKEINDEGGRPAVLEGGVPRP